MKRTRRKFEPTNLKILNMLESGMKILLCHLMRLKFLVASDAAHNVVWSPQLFLTKDADYSGSSASGLVREAVTVGLMAAQRKRQTSGSLFILLPIVFHDGRDFASFLSDINS